MYTVERYIIPKEEGTFSLEMPGQTRLLSVQEQQYGTPYLWALVNHEASVEKRSFLHVATGTPIEESPFKMKYLATFHLKTINYIGHIFEIK